MNYIDDGIGNSNIIMYTTEDGLSKIETTFDGDTVWLSKARYAVSHLGDRHLSGYLDFAERQAEREQDYFISIKILKKRQVKVKNS